MTKEEALERAKQKLLAMPTEELKKRFAEHEPGDIAKLLLDSGMFNLPQDDEVSELKLKITLLEKRIEGLRDGLEFYGDDSCKKSHSKNQLNRLHKRVAEFALKCDNEMKEE